MIFTVISEQKQQLVEDKDADNIRKGPCSHSFSGFENLICVLIRTKSAVLIHLGYSFVAVEVKVYKYNKTFNVRSLRKPVSVVFPQVLMFPETEHQDSRETKLLNFFPQDLTLNLHYLH